MKRFLLFLFSLITGLTLFLLITTKIGWQIILHSLSLFRHWQGIIIFILTLSGAILNIYRWQFILKLLGYDFSLKELGDIWLGGNTITYLTPIAILGGEVFMSMALRKKLRVPWGKNIISIAILRISNLTCTLFFVSLGIILFLFLGGLPSKDIFLISILVISGLTGSLFVFYYQSFRKKSILRIFLRNLNKGFTLKNFLNSQGILQIEEEIFSFLNPKKKIIWQTLGLAFLSLAVNLIRLELIIFFLKKQFVTLFSLLPMFAFVNLAYILPFPAALGSLEISQAFIFNFLDLGPDLGTAFSLILRGAELSLALIGIFFLLKLWFKFRALEWLLEKFAIVKKEFLKN